MSNLLIGCTIQNIQFWSDNNREQRYFYIYQAASGVGQSKKYV